MKDLFQLMLEMLVFIFLTFLGQNTLDVVDLFLHAFQNSIKNLRAIHFKT